MGKKKFIDKRNAATFHLLARDTYASRHDQNPGSDHVFVRVDANPVSIDGFEDDIDDDSKYCGDSNDQNPRSGDDGEFGRLPSWLRVEESGPLPDNVRREILELGFPDDGYNYLLHMREIKNTGGGSFYYENPKANLEQLPLDVKAYDASRIQIKEENLEAAEERTIYKVAEKTVNVKVQRAVDPEVLALLDDNESQAGSDVDDLEEDFVTRANIPEEGVSSDAERYGCGINESEDGVFDDAEPVDLHGDCVEARVDPAGKNVVKVVEKPRVRRTIDEQFDVLQLQEYETDSENDDVYCDYEDEEQQPLAEKLNNALKNHNIDDFDIDEPYKAPADILRSSENAANEELVSSAAEILRRCSEYGEKYENADEDDQEMVMAEESSDESEAWDCETIVSTYSNLDNHPGRIGVPESRRKKKLSETISGALKGSDRNIIHLAGREKIPVSSALQGRNMLKEKVKPIAKVETPTRKHGQESKEEKKERKAAIKEEKREARRMKKETKELFRFEAQRAQKTMAITGPSSIRLS